MKREKRAQLIREAVAAGRADAQRRSPLVFLTVDLITGLGDGPEVISFPVDPMQFMSDGRFTIDLARVGYRLTPE